MKRHCHSTTFEWYVTSRIVSYIDLDRCEFSVQDGNVGGEREWRHLADSVVSDGCELIVSKFVRLNFIS